ncbi:Ribonuclease H-like domain [Lasallia pustulata]|uniref:Ribonuclease H-like domain n=1 Tax=Lasallia pustulata TaxID=136370 RepID=A0A1W5CT10_9LECA|nr:Ribonuclease H-like domain [Lasallia pustulata]
MYTRKTTLTLTETEKEAFKFLQKSFDEPTFLTFFDRQRQLYININRSKQWGFDIMVYHVKGDPGGNDFPRKSIQPVMFLSKLLNNAERNYWLTELEVAALVWTLRKTRHLVESCTKPAIVFTDHSATTSIAKQMTLSSSSTDKLVKAYNEDKQWSKIIGALRKHAESQKKEKEPEPPKNIQFRLIEGLVYYQELDGRRRLCIPKSLEKKVFELAHDDNHHCGFHRAYDAVTSNLYLRKLSKHLKRYIDHCYSCQLNQTKRHVTYGSMVPIVMKSLPFRTIAMDFILGLPETEDGFDVALSVTDKCSKRVTLLLGKNTYKAEDWATVLLEGLTDWGIPDAIITDQDPKFMSEFWKELATKLKIEMLTSTAYHPQTDGQSEQTNQTAEIALRYFLTSSSKSNWAKYLPRLRSELNKQRNASTGKSPDEVVYGFKLRDTLSIIGGKTESADSDFVKERLVIRKEAEDAANFANLLTKLQYDKHHRRLSIEVGDEVFIKLHKGYTLPSVTNRKLSNQRAGPLKIVEKIGLLAYRLNIPVNWKIHPVISVAQLEPAPKGNDLYEREDRPSDPPAVEEFNSEWHDYKVEKLVGRRDRKLGKGKKITEYLVRWKGYSSVHNQWYGKDMLESSKELIEEYDKEHRPTKEVATDTSKQTHDPNIYQAIKDDKGGPDRELRPGDFVGIPKPNSSIPCGKAKEEEEERNGESLYRASPELHFVVRKGESSPTPVAPPESHPLPSIQNSLLATEPEQTSHMGIPIRSIFPSHSGTTSTSRAEKQAFAENLSIAPSTLLKDQEGNTNDKEVTSRTRSLKPFPEDGHLGCCLNSKKRKNSSK